MLKKLKNILTRVIYLDEKWIYFISHSKKLKTLPKKEFEAEVVDKLKVRKVVNQSYPTKVMFMGALTSPYPESNFDGELMMKRISKTKQVERTSYSANLIDNTEINNLIKEGDWKHLHDNNPPTTFSELLKISFQNPSILKMTLYPPS